ncbi:shikimate kinase [Kiritimatiellota bacterium B12222]|nr:shikimate kinase [Kiritimatiellota bacterium B12222]
MSGEEPIFLVGFMGSGKTRVGKLLSKRLGWGWVDLDHEIEAQAQMPISEIFKKEGESGFRLREKAVLDQFSQQEEIVVSCGGGIVTEADNLKQLLSLPRVVCLRLTPETVFKRVGNDPRRPLLHGQDPYGQIQKLMKAREGYYVQFSHQIDVDRLRTAEVVNEIIGLFGLDAFDTKRS